MLTFTAHALILYPRKSHDRILSTPSEPQPSPEPSVFTQLAYIDAPFLSWDFRLWDEERNELGFITRSFRGFGREVWGFFGPFRILIFNQYLLDVH